MPPPAGRITLGVEAVNTTLAGRGLSAAWADGTLPWLIVHAVVLGGLGWIAYSRTLRRARREGCSARGERHPPVGHQLRQRDPQGPAGRLVRETADSYAGEGVTLFTTEIHPTDQGYDLSPLQGLLAWRGHS